MGWAAHREIAWNAKGMWERGAFTLGKVKKEAVQAACWKGFWTEII